MSNRAKLLLRHVTDGYTGFRAADHFCHTLEEREIDEIDNSLYDVTQNPPDVGWDNILRNIANSCVDDSWLRPILLWAADDKTGENA